MVSTTAGCTSHAACAPERPRDLLVVVPAWNEQASVGHVIKEIGSACPEADVLVVDDGSTDATASVAKQAGAAVLRLPYNLGVGGAMRAGFRYALRSGYRVVVQVDADGQHDPAAIHRLVDGASTGPTVPTSWSAPASPARARTRSARRAGPPCGCSPGCSRASPRPS